MRWLPELSARHPMSFRRRVQVVSALLAALAMVPAARAQDVSSAATTPPKHSRDGKPVPTRIPSFKVRFSLRENE
jgi:hypothetical protein